MLMPVCFKLVIVDAKTNTVVQSMALHRGEQEADVYDLQHGNSYLACLQLQVCCSVSQVSSHGSFWSFDISMIWFQQPECVWPDLALELRLTSQRMHELEEFIEPRARVLIDTEKILWRKEGLFKLFLSFLAEISVSSSSSSHHHHHYHHHRQ